jgi:hypothetical protein
MNTPHTTTGPTPKSEEAHIEPALLVQPLNGEAGQEEAGSGKGATTFGSPVPLCVAGLEGPCARDAKGKQGEKCGSMYGKPCHHSGGGHSGGGAALTPGVDIFGAPLEVGCAGYGAVRGVEAIVEAL